MSISLLRSCGFSLLVVAFVCLSSQAALIDDFATPNQNIDLGGTAAPTSSSDNSGAATNTVGGSREIVLSKLMGGAGGATNASQLTAGGGFFSMASGSSVQNAATATWDGNANGTLQPLGLAGVDLTDSGASSQFNLGINFMDLAGDISITVGDMSSNVATATHSLAGGINSLTPEVFLFSEFAGVDFSDVGFVQLLVDNAATGLDIDITFLETTGNQVPEPASMALWSLLGLAVAGFFYRCRKR